MTPLEFGNTAKKFTHNPLGIIALFIVLIYAFASLVVGLGSNLEPAQKTPLIWFLVAFPVLVLVVFAWLVSRHHTKLYAPMDFRDEKLFIYPLSAEVQRQRIQEEIENVEAQELEADSRVKLPIENKSLSPSNTKTISTSNSRDTFTSNYLLAEDLAIRQLETELKVPILKQVEIVTANTHARFDGFINDKKEITGIEVKYARIPKISPSTIQSSLFRFVDLSNRFRLDDKNILVKFIFVFVTELGLTQLAEANNADSPNML
jgi:hypothetical protein